MTLVEHFAKATGGVDRFADESDRGFDQYPRCKFPAPRPQMLRLGIPNAPASTRTSGMIAQVVDTFASATPAKSTARVSPTSPPTANTIGRWPSQMRSQTNFPAELDVRPTVVGSRHLRKGNEIEHDLLRQAEIDGRLSDIANLKESLRAEARSNLPEVSRLAMCRPGRRVAVLPP